MRSSRKRQSRSFLEALPSLFPSIARWLLLGVLLVGALLVIRMGWSWSNQEALSALPLAPPVDPILKACPPETQALAFKESERPDFAALGVDLCYRVEMHLNETGDTFEATTHTTVRNGSQSEWPHLFFRLYPQAPVVFGGNISIESAYLGGQEIPSQRLLDDQTGIYIPLPTPLQPGDVAQVELTLRGQLADFHNRPQTVGLFAYTPSSSTMASWFPLLAVWDDEQGIWHDPPVRDVGDAVFSESAFIQATLSAPARYNLSTSGTLLTQLSDDERTTYTVVTGPARELALVWMNGYGLLTEEQDGTTIRSWYQLGSEEGGRTALSTTQDALMIYNSAFGPYPFKELELVQAPLRQWGGMEYPQLILLSDVYYRLSPTSQDFATLIAHEIAHQWWYSAVGSNVQQHPWQDEALSEWSSLLWLERSTGRNNALTSQEHFKFMIESFENQEGSRPLSQSTAALEGKPDSYYALVYAKGALFFSTLREEIGDDAFFNALHQYHTTYRYHIATPENLLTLFEQSSQRSLSELYAEWGLREPPTPTPIVSE